MARYFRNSQVIATIVVSDGRKPRWLRRFQRDTMCKIHAALHKYSCLIYPNVGRWTRKERECDARGNIETERIDRGIRALMLAGFTSG